MPARMRTRRISSTAYADDEIASELKMARAFFLVSLSSISWALASGRPKQDPFDPSRERPAAGQRSARGLLGDHRAGTRVAEIACVRPGDDHSPVAELASVQSGAVVLGTGNPWRGAAIGRGREPATEQGDQPPESGATRPGAIRMIVRLAGVGSGQVTLNHDAPIPDLSPLDRTMAVHGCEPLALPRPTGRRESAGRYSATLTDKPHPTMAGSPQRRQDPVACRSTSPNHVSSS